MTRVGSVLDQVEVALSRLSLVPTMLQATSTSCPSSVASVSSVEDMGAELYGCLPYPSCSGQFVVHVYLDPYVVYC